MNRSQLEVVHNQCVDIIKEIKFAGYFVTYEQVLSVLLDRYSVLNLSQIGINTPSHVPVLNWLFSIQNKITIFLSISLTNNNNKSSIVSIADLNEELYLYLKGFCYPSLNNFIHNEIVKVNQPVDDNEINIDTVETTVTTPQGCGTSEETSVGLEWFGIGEIWQHSTIRSYFHLPAIAYSSATTSPLSQSIKYTVSALDICRHLVNFLSDPFTLSSKYSDSGSSSNNQFDHEKFHNYILSIYQITQLNEIGVVFVGNFELERLTFAYIINRCKLQFVELRNQELALLYQQPPSLKYQPQQQQQQQHSDVQVHTKSQQQSLVASASASASTYSSPSPAATSTMTMKPPVKPSIQLLLQEIISLLNIRRKGSVYSPSYKQVFDCLTADFLGLHSKRKRGNNNDNDNEVEDGRNGNDILNSLTHHTMKPKQLLALLEATCEYIMLHVGGRKYLAKRLQHDNDDNDENHTAPVPDKQKLPPTIDDDANNEECEVESSSQLQEATNCDCDVDAIESVKLADVTVTTATTTATVTATDTTSTAAVSATTATTSIPLSSSALKHGADRNHPSTMKALMTSPPPLTGQQQHQTQPQQLHQQQQQQQQQQSHTQYAPPFETKRHTNNPLNCQLTRKTKHNEHNGLQLFIHSSDLSSLTQCMATSYTPSLSSSLLSSVSRPGSGSVLECGRTSAADDDLKWVGRWGEQLVYHYLLLKHSSCSHTGAAITTPPPPSSSSSSAAAAAAAATGSSHAPYNNVTVEWMNEVEESKACYDLILTTKLADGRCHRQYIEVKSTRFPDNNVFEISLNEWQFASGLPLVNYSIYRVYNAGDISKASICIIPDVLSYLNERKIKLCLAI